MKSLNDIGLKYNTDKAGKHNFLKVYEKYLEKDKDSIKNILELGIYNGSSIRMWRDYLPNANIYGIDMLYSRLSLEKTTLFKCHQSNIPRMLGIMKKIGNDIDIIIDDCSHRMDDQQTSLAALFPYVKKNGLYVIEDVHTSNDWQLERYNIYIDRSNTTLKMINDYNKDKRILSHHIKDEDKEYLEKNIKSMELYDTNKDGKHMICFIRKK